MKEPIPIRPAPTSWETAIDEVEFQLRVARQLVSSLEQLLESFRSMRAAGENWPGI